MSRCFCSVLLLMLAGMPRARGDGPYPATTGVPANDVRIHGWASAVVLLTRGPQEIGSTLYSAPASFGSPSDALGMANATPGDPTPVVSLGDGGSITLSFDTPIANKTGADLAVFENSFDGSFLELAFVEVSSNGRDFLRFPAISLTQTRTQINGDDGSGSIDTVDPTYINNLAGKYAAGFGTPFDLNDLKGLPNAGLLDFNNVRFVRIVDVVGSLDPQFGTRDSKGNLINDPWPTPYETSGFDLDAVAALNVIPEPSPTLLLGMSALLLARRRRGGFTLVELLTVIGIIVILAALLVVAAPRVFAYGESMRCLSNLRQLAAANFLYVSDHDGRFVPAQEPTNLIRWHGVRTGMADQFDPTKGPLAPYLGSEGRVKACPTFINALSGKQSFENGTGGYGYNAAYIGGMPGNVFQPERLGNIAQPARTVMFCDTAFPRASGLQEYAYCEPWQQENPLGTFRGKMSASVHFRHDGLANVAWCDGHASSELPTRLDGGNGYGGSGTHAKVGWFGPSVNNGYWRPY